jgi:hypothetical protein
MRSDRIVMRRTVRVRSRRLAALVATAAAGYMLVVRGVVTLDLGLGRRVRPLGPIRLEVAASPETLFDVIAGPYLAKTPRAMRSKLQLGQLWGQLVARTWERAVQRSLDVAHAEPQRRAGQPSRTSGW